MIKSVIPGVSALSKARAGIGEGDPLLMARSKILIPKVIQKVKENKLLGWNPFDEESLSPEFKENMKKIGLVAVILVAFVVLFYVIKKRKR